MYITILGRQSVLGLAELERVYGSVARFSDTVATLTDAPDILQLGGSLKTGRVIFTLPRGEWRDVERKVIAHYESAWRTSDHKLTLGMSIYGLRAGSRDIQRTGLELKKRLKTQGVSVRLIPNNTPTLNTATSHHNKLGLSSNKVELLIAKGTDGSIIVAESTGAQHITALAGRDQGRPKRDAFVGMLPPKLAQIIINLAVGAHTRGPDGHSPMILDPFCGTGVILQEALLLGYMVHGSDLSEKMIDYTLENLAWLQRTHRDTGTILTVRPADATDYTWAEASILDAVACETYLGQPFSAPPSPSKLREVRGNCNHIIGSFLTNIGKQLTSGTTLCVAVPAWRAHDGSFTHLPLTRDLDSYGYRRIPLTSVRAHELLYYREDQVVARELLVLEKL